MIFQDHGAQVSEESLMEVTVGEVKWKRCLESPPLQGMLWRKALRPLLRWNMGRTKI